MRILIPLLTMLLATPIGARASGLLELQSQPGVTVTWEGVVLGKTTADGSMVIEGIPPGQYRLSLSRSGFQTFEATIDVAADSRSSQRWMLERVSPSRDPSVERRSVEPSLEPPVESSPGEGESEASLDEASEPPGDGEEGKSLLQPQAAAESDSRRSDHTIAIEPTPEATAQSRIAEAPKADAPVSVSPLLAGLAVLTALLLGAFGARRFSARTAIAEPPSSRPRAKRRTTAEDELPVFEELEPEPQKFLEDLKRREQNLEVQPAPAVSPDETIIEVEAIEVRPADKP